MNEQTCYICDPDNPNADEEGCQACEQSFLAYYAAAYWGTP